ncbi:MAG: sodium:proton antiporter [Candidatus Poseidoniaceae archaeon]|jgi:CPA1 family monovalent cation:H+ antiporter|nr:sodium:proton antiporter [Candidatus Poseidoniaceae archaeon]
MSAIPPSALGPLLGALTMAIMVALAIRRFNMPYTIALVIAGLVLGLMSRFDDLFSIELSGILSAEVILFLILPPLLFDGASKLSFHSFKRNWRLTILLAVPAVIISMFSIGLIIWVLIWQGDPEMFLFALLLGAVLAPTDPVSVLALFKECGAPHQLSTIVEGESLFNDGTGVVLFQVMAALVAASLMGDSSSLGSTLLEGALKFVQMVVIGSVVGAAIAFAANTALVWTRNHLLEVTITVAVAFGSFLLAEHFQGSGVIAVVVAGMMVGNIGKLQAMTPQARVGLDHFWEMVAFLMNSVLFLLIGFEMMERIEPSGDALLMILVAILAATIARLSIYPMCEIVTRWSPDSDIPKPWRHVIFWGGLRGSIPLALMLILLDQWILHPDAELAANLPSGVYDEMLLMAFSVVLFTLLVQGMTITPLMKKLGVGQDADGNTEKFEIAVATLMSSGAALLELQRMKEMGLAPVEQLDEAIASEKSRIDESRELLEELKSDESFKDRMQGRLDARLLAIRQRAVDDAERQGLISEHISLELRWKLDTDLTLLLEEAGLLGEVPLPQAIEG